MGIRDQKSDSQRAEVRSHRSLTWFSREPRDGATIKVSLFFLFLPFPLRPRPFFFPFPFPFRRGGGDSGSPWGTWDEYPNQSQRPSVEAPPLRSPGTVLAHDPWVLHFEARGLLSLVSMGQGQSYDLRPKVIQLCDLRSRSLMPIYDLFKGRGHSAPWVRIRLSLFLRPGARDDSR